MSSLASLQVPAVLFPEWCHLWLHVQFSEELHIVYTSAAPFYIPIEATGFNMCPMNIVYVVLYSMLRAWVVFQGVHVYVFSSNY